LVGGHHPEGSEESLECPEAMVTGDTARRPRIASKRGLVTPKRGQITPPGDALSRLAIPIATVSGVPSSSPKNRILTNVGPQRPTRGVRNDVRGTNPGRNS